MDVANIGENMQTNITDYNIKKSIYNLDEKRLFSNIYENIHGLGCLLNCVDDLILSDKAKIQAKKLKNKSQCKLWVGFEVHLLSHIVEAYDRWYEEFADKEKTEYNETINYKNIKILLENSKLNVWNFSEYYPDWVTEKVIQVHRSHLIQKEIEKENKINNEMFKKCYGNPENIMVIKKYQEKLKNNYHYRNLWPDCPRDLKMKYDWIISGSTKNIDYYFERGQIFK